MAMSTAVERSSSQHPNGWVMEIDATNAPKFEGTLAPAPMTVVDGRQDLPWVEKYRPQRYVYVSVFLCAVMSVSP